MILLQHLLAVNHIDAFLRVGNAATAKVVEYILLALTNYGVNTSGISFLWVL